MTITGFLGRRAAALALAFTLSACATEPDQRCRWQLVAEPRLMATMPLETGVVQPSAQLMVRPVCVPVRRARP